MSTNQIPLNEHSISFKKALEMTGRYGENKETILAEEFKGQDILTLSETFNKEAFDPFFTNTDCKAIRIYYGMSEALKVHAIIVGVNEKNEDILPSESQRDEAESSGILEDGQRCPPYCPPPPPPPSLLNE